MLASFIRSITCGSDERSKSKSNQNAKNEGLLLHFEECIKRIEAEPRAELFKKT